MPDSDRSSRVSRRDLLALGVGAFVVAAIPFASRRGSRRLVRRSVPVMGTIADLAVVAEDPAVAQVALDAAIAELRWVDATMTRYRADSEVGSANLAAGREAVHVSAGTALVLERSLAWAEASEGVFDPCLGRAAAAWEVTQRTAPPTADVLRPLARGGLAQGGLTRGGLTRGGLTRGGLTQGGLWRALDVSTWQGRPAVRLHDEHAAIDLGGIAKGFGVDLAAAALRDHGIEHALVNVGGDLYALGTSEDGDPWRVGIRSPEDPTRLIGKIAIRDEAVATSGDYERRFRHAGRTYHHLLDPTTAAPRETAVHSVSVTADTCMAADAAATAAFGLDARAAGALFARVAPDARIVSSA